MNGNDASKCNEGTMAITVIEESLEEMEVFFLKSKDQQRFEWKRKTPKRIIFTKCFKISKKI